jgi:DNA-binding IclR family transcriptional regulator
MNDISVRAGRPGAPSSGGVQVISRAAAILRTLREAPDGLSLGQIAKAVGLPRSTVQRIVGALSDERLVMAASAAGRVRLGPEIYAFAGSSRPDTMEAIHPLIRALSEATGETVDLSVLRKDQLVFLDQVIGSHRLRTVSAVGEAFPLHSTANGKAALALMADAEITSLLPKTLAISEGRRRPLKDLLAEIDTIRRTGIAYDEGEHTADISAVGVAFRDGAGTIHAISIPVPSGRFNRSRERLSAMILKTRAEVGRLIGV